MFRIIRFFLYTGQPGQTGILSFESNLSSSSPAVRRWPTPAAANLNTSPKTSTLKTSGEMLRPTPPTTTTTSTPITHLLPLLPPLPTPPRRGRASTSVISRAASSRFDAFSSSSSSYWSCFCFMFCCQMRCIHCVGDDMLGFLWWTCFFWYLTVKELRLLWPCWFAFFLFWGVGGVGYGALLISCISKFDVFMIVHLLFDLGIDLRFYIWSLNVVPLVKAHYVYYILIRLKWWLYAGWK